MKLRGLLLLPGILSLIACGGGGGGNDKGGDPLVGLKPGDPLGSPGYELTVDNYVVIASGMYHGATSVGWSTGLYQASALLMLQDAGEPESVNSCDVSGDVVHKNIKKTFAEWELSSGDSFEHTFRNCVNNAAAGAETGTRSFKLTYINGLNDEDDFVVRMEDRQDVVTTGSTNNSDGEYRIYMPAVHASAGDDHLIGVNLAKLYEGLESEVVGQKFEGVINEEIALGTTLSEPLHYESPDMAFDTFAFQFVSRNTEAGDASRMRWLFDVKNKQDSAGNHVTRTLRELVLEERVVPDPEDGEEITQQVAISGQFEFLLETGSVIQVEVTGFDEVKVSLDLDADGVAEDVTTLNWEEFKVAPFIWWLERASL